MSGSKSATGSKIATGIDNYDTFFEKIKAEINASEKRSQKHLTDSMEPIVEQLAIFSRKVTEFESELKRQATSIVDMKKDQTDCNAKVYNLSLEIQHTAAAAELQSREFLNEMNRWKVMEERISTRSKVVLVAEGGTVMPAQDAETLSTVLDTKVKSARIIKSRDGTSKMTLTLEHEEDATNLVKKKRVGGLRVFREQGPMGRKEGWLAKQVKMHVRTQDTEGRFRWIWTRHGFMVMDAIEKKWAKYPLWDHAESIDLSGKLRCRDLDPLRTMEVVKRSLNSGGEPIPEYITIPQPPSAPPAPSNRAPPPHPPSSQPNRDKRPHESGSGMTPLPKDRQGRTTHT